MERRRFKRLPKRIAVRYGEEGLAYSGVTRDLSLGGAFVAGGRLPQVDARIHLQLVLEGGRCAYLEGRVRRHRIVPPALRQLEPSGFGVEFVKPRDVVAEILPANGDLARFDVSVPTRQALGELWSGQLKMGGIFVRTERSLARDAPATVALSLDFCGREFDFAARVVQVVQGAAPGLALAFEERDKVGEALQPFLG